MTSVSLDTSGYALTPSIEPGLYNAVVWSDLSPFEQGNVEGVFASLWSNLAEHYGEGFIGVRFSFSDLAPETLAAIRKDCAAALATQLYGASDGAFFWQERQEGNVEAHPHLTDFPRLTPTLGEDGKVRIAPVAGTAERSSRSGRTS